MKVSGLMICSMAAESLPITKDHCTKASGNVARRSTSQASTPTQLRKCSCILKIIDSKRHTGGHQST